MDEIKAKLFTDGGARGNPGPAGLGCILFDQTDHLLGFDAQYAGTLTNNQAEYQALILGLTLARSHSVQDLIVYMDSELIVKQMNGEYKVKDAGMKQLKEKADALRDEFDSVLFMHVERAKNRHADKLVNLVLDAAQS